MPMLRALRMLNNLESGALTGAALQTLLADTGRLGDLVSLLTQRGYSRRLAASSTAMTAVAASSIAMTALLASPSALSALLASPTALSAMVASSTAMTVVAASSPAIATFAESNVALAAIFGSSVAKTALYDSASGIAWLVAVQNAKDYLKTIAVQTTTLSTTHDSVNVGRTLLVQQHASSATYYSRAGASADSYNTNSITYIDRFVKVTNLTHRTDNASYYSYVTYIDMD